MYSKVRQSPKIKSDCSKSDPMGWRESVVSAAFLALLEGAGMRMMLSANAPMGDSGTMVKSNNLAPMFLHFLA